MVGRRLLTTAIGCGLVGAAIVGVEALTRRGIAEATLYSIVVLISLRVRNTAFVVSIAALCSVLTILGFFISHAGEESLVIAIANRGLAILAIWLMALLGLVMQSSQAAHDKLRRQFDAHNEQLRLARKIQQKLFPKAAPPLSGFDIAGACLPADATGGDYFDFISLSDGCLGIAVGDVSSHGFGPALLMAEARAVIRSLALVQSDVGEILTQANRLVCQDMEDDQFITVFLGSLDPRERTLVYASAGQQGLFLDDGGDVTKLESTGLPLGVEPTNVIPCAPAIHLAGGSFLLLITDGVFEATNVDGDSFGIERALDTVRANLDQRAESIVESIFQAVRAFSQGKCQSDDITAVALKSESIPAPMVSITEVARSLMTQGRIDGAT